MNCLPVGSISISFPVWRASKRISRTELLLLSKGLKHVVFAATSEIHLSMIGITVMHFEGGKVVERWDIDNSSEVFAELRRKQSYAANPSIAAVGPNWPGHQRSTGSNVIVADLRTSEDLEHWALARPRLSAAAPVDW